MNIRAALAASLLASGIAQASAGDDSLMRAIRNDDPAGVRAALAAHANPNERLPDGSTPLAWAVEIQDAQIIDLLLDHGAAPNGARDGSLSPLILACESGDARTIGRLLDVHADAKVSQADGITPLAVCAGTAPTSILERMISNGAEVDRADAAGQTPLMRAAAGGRLDNVRFLLAHGAQLNRRTNKGLTPLFFALKSTEPQAADILLEAGADADYVAPDGTSAVQMAMYQGKYAFAARLIDRGTNLTQLDRNGNQLLHAAILASQPTLVRLLLAKGADANALTGESKVKWRFEVNFTSAVYNVPRKSPLLLAAGLGSTQIMQILVHAGADATFRAADGSNVVLASVTSGKADALAFALQLQPDANITTADGKTALHLLLSSVSDADGVSDQTTAMMKLLADRGARVDIKNHEGQTAVDIAEDEQSNTRTAFEAVFGKPKVSKL